MKTTRSRIERVEAFVIERPISQPFSFSQGTYDRRAACLVRVTADDGTYGWGEGYGPARVVAAGVEYLRACVLGQDPLSQSALWEKMHARSLDHARRGVLVASLSAIDIALWDLKGKLLGQPVNVLLGGVRRERVGVYATGLYFTEGPDLRGRLAREAEGYIRAGFPAVKMKVGLNVREDAENVRAVRAAIGPDAGLMIDANHAFSRAEAAALACAVEDQQIGWFEEPLSPEDYEGYQELRSRTRIPIAGGECESLADGFRHLLGGRCVDMAQPDLCAAGGLTEGQRILALARVHGANVTPHCWGTGVAFAAALHFTATLDVLPGRLNAPEPLLEMDRTENPLRDELASPQFTVVQGTVGVPQAAGLGIDVDEDALNRFQER